MKDTDKRNESIRVMRENGVTLAAIAAEFGISKERVRQICNRENRREKVLGDWLAQFTIRTGNALARSGIVSEADLYAAVLNGHCSIRNFGNNSLAELNRVIPKPLRFNRPYGGRRLLVLEDWDAKQTDKGPGD